MSNLVKAIRELSPTAEFAIIDNDLENIEWHVIDGPVPTKKEILDAASLIEKREAVKASEAVEKKAALLERLGITEDEAKLLLG
jgi:hypothetical protein